MSQKLAEVKEVLECAITDTVFPGCVFSFFDEDESFVVPLGRHTYHNDSPLVTEDTVYDVASFTKIIGPMALAMMLIDEGVLDLDEKVGTYVPEFVSTPGKGKVLLSHLMAYTVDFSVPGGAKSLMGTLSPAEVAKNCLEFPLNTIPGTSYMYTNISAFVLTQIIERVTRRNFYELVAEKILLPLEMTTATFAPRQNEIANIPPTEVTSGRGEVKGVVHDESTAHMMRGGISNGAAGLFAAVGDIKKFLIMALGCGVYKGKRIFSEEMVARWVADYYPQLLPTRTPLGWGDTNNELIAKYHRNIVVKGGFTGCFMWGDLQYKRGFVPLSNRTYPVRPDDSGAFGRVKEELAKIVTE